MVLDGIVGPSGQFFGNVGPFIAKLLMGLENGLFLLIRPRTLVDIGV